MRYFGSFEISQKIPVETGRGRRLGGFSLVELMVSLAIASVLLLGLVILFAGNSASRTELDKSSQQIENGRYALQMLTDEVRHAGYYGPLVSAPTSSLTALPDPCYAIANDGTNDDITKAMTLPMQGYAGAASASALDTGKLACLTAAAGYKPNTAVLVVRRASTSATTGFNSAYFNIQVSGCFADTSKYILSKTSSAFTLHTNTSPGCTPLTSAPTATISPYFVRIYFISTCSGTDCTASGADTVPTLKRIDLLSGGTTGNITPIVDGIENLQLDYGIDTSGDGVPDVYTNTTAHPASTPSSVTEWSQVMSVRIYLLARNSQQTTGYTDTKKYSLGPVTINSPGDAYKRHAYAELARLINPAERLE